MKSFGRVIRKLREEKGEPLRVVAAYLQVDQAILSKIERGQRNATKAQVEKLAEYFDADCNELLTTWLSDRIIYAIKDEDLALEALKLAEEIVVYRKSGISDRQSVINKIKRFFQADGRIEKAWIFGSFAKGNHKPSSDIDIMIIEDENVKFSYFDLADIQHHLERTIHRKVDIGFASALKNGLKHRIEKDAILIYEKS